MTTVYVHPIDGNDTNSGLSALQPKRTRAGARAVVNNGNHQILVRAGTTEVVGATINPCIGVSATQPFTWGTYGGSERATVAPLNAGVTDLMYILSGFKNNVIENWDFDSQGLAVRPLQVQCASGDTLGTVLRNCRFSTGNSGFNGLFIDNKRSGTDKLTLTTYDCLFERNGGHGVFAQGDCLIEHWRGTAAQNGATSATGGHGFSSTAYRTTFSSGWTFVSATTYYRALSAKPFKVLHAASGTIPVLAENTATPTTPSVGQWGWDIGNGRLYVNTGVNANTIDISVQVSPSPTILYAFCDAWGNIYNPATPFREGHGFAADDFTSGMRAIGCRSWDNGGNGFSLNGGDGNALYGNVVWGNALPSVQIWRGGGHRIVNNTFIGNNVVGYAPGDVRMSGASTGNLIANNIIRGGGLSTVGIEADAISLGQTVVNNLIFDVATRLSGTTESGALAFDPAPYLLTDFSLRLPPETTLATLAAANPLAVAGAYYSGTRLRNGRARPGGCPVGAYQAVLPRAQKS